MANYNNVKGAHYARFVDDESDPVTAQEGAEVEEMYFDENSGGIVLTVATDDGLLSLEIPVNARLDFNEFKYSLPEIDL